MCVSRHYDMARPLVAYERGILHKLKVAANTLNKQSRMVDKGWPVTWAGADNP
jgi:hypothetical protein